MPRKTKYTREDVVEAGIEVLRGGGWEGLTPKSVAHNLGASTMPIFSHFSTMEDLREAILDRAWEMVLEYVDREYTGDAWVDQGIGYVLFARDHDRLFGCMHYGPPGPIHDRRYKFWLRITRDLENHPAFLHMAPMRAGWIRHIRSLLTHGIAVSVGSGLSAAWEDEELVRQMMLLCSDILYQGLSGHGERLDEIIGGVAPEIMKRISGRADE